MKDKKTLKKILFIAIFALIGFIALKIPFNNIVGSKQAFTLFDFMGPVGGMILGAWPAALSVILVKATDFLISGDVPSFTAIIRFFPMAAAALYFGTKSKKISIIPIVCMILFWAHPEGRQAWYFALLWLIPIVSLFKKDRLILNSLGATFTAHAIGSTAFLYALNLPAAVWTGLVPVVLIERGLFAIGTWVSFLVVNSLLNKITQYIKIRSLKVNENYTFSKEFLRKYS
ncbi:MAG: hypothetical protein HQ538_04025 [Parcubacteria group bacterium]|nr:hypothetical protein [Parcubacteria group bacterium]